MPSALASRALPSSLCCPSAPHIRVDLYEAGVVIGLRRRAWEILQDLGFQDDIVRMMGMPLTEDCGIDSMSSSDIDSCLFAVTGRTMRYRNADLPEGITIVDASVRDPFTPAIAACLRRRCSRRGGRRNNCRAPHRFQRNAARRRAATRRLQEYDDDDRQPNV